MKPAMQKIPTDEAAVQHTINVKLPPILDYLESQLSAYSFFMGETPTIVDFTIPGMFLNASYGQYKVDAKRWPKLAAYIDRTWKHPLYAKQIAIDAETFKMFVS